MQRAVNYLVRPYLRYIDAGSRISPIRIPAVFATVTVGDRPFGVAVTPDGDHVYVANSSSFTVSVIEGVYTSTSTTNSASSGLPGYFPGGQRCACG
jgi:YVTN family beta-propeller protein